MYICASVASTKALPAPKKAMIHIHTMAPGPPKPMAVATPTMLPVPTRPESAIAKAWNDEMPTERLSLPALPNSRRNISPKRRTCTKRVRSEK